MPAIAALQDNCTFVCPVWKMTAKDGAVIAYAVQSRSLVVDGVTYSAAWPTEETRIVSKTGLDPDTAELTGVFNDDFTEADLYAKKWEGARIYRAYVVNALDLTKGVVAERHGFAGKFTKVGDRFTVEFNSLSKALEMEMGDLTSAVDRNAKPEDLGVSMAAFTHNRTVVTAADRRTFTVGGAAQSNSYFMYGRAEWTGGDNDGLQMEIEDNTGNTITLALPMPSAIDAGDTVTLIAGYDGTREQARDKFNAAISFNGEPDMPGLRVFEYPQ